VIGRIGVEPSLDGPRGHLQRPTPRRRLDRLEIQRVDGAGAYERLDLGAGFRRKRLSEPPFLAPSARAASSACNSASPHCSQASQ
jgi:hypothetical protein